MPKIPGTFTNNNGDSDEARKLVYNSDSDLVVHSCSTHATEHIAGCDGTCEDHIMDRLDIALFNEDLEWAHIGMSDDMYSSKALYNDAKLQTIFRLLKEHVDIPEEIVQETFKEELLQIKQFVRSVSGEAVKQARLHAQIVQGRPGLFGPNGERL